jgi:hypothetical protein
VINTRNNLDLHYPQSHLSLYQKGAHYTGITVFNRLPVAIREYAVAQWLRHYATNRKVAGSILDEVNF